TRRCIIWPCMIRLVGDEVYKGCSYGWVVILGHEGGKIYLLNPLTGAKIDLPPRSTFPDVKEYSGLSYHRSNPATDSDYVAVANYGEYNGLAYCKRGEDKWTSLIEDGTYHDFIFYKGKLYIICCSTTVTTINIFSYDPQVEDIIPPCPDRKAKLGEKYLVESSSGLLMVQRLRLVSSNPDEKSEILSSYRTTTFNVFRLDEGCLRWERISDIGDDEHG
ncbi:hypothetical protein Tsubulata_010120, partial [Turnera subulata]